MPCSFALALVEALSIIIQAGLLAWIVSRLLIDGASLADLWPPLLGLLAAWLLRAGTQMLRGQLSAGASSRTRSELRRALFDRLAAAGPLYRGPRGTGQLGTSLIEQVDLLDPFYSRYLPQTSSAMLIPAVILIAVFMADWLAGLLLLFTAPLIPGFMIIIGIGAKQISQRQQEALGRLSGVFFDRLQGLDTLKRFGAEQRELEHMRSFSDQFRVRTMQVLRVAFLSSAVLEFFSAVAIAVLAIYIGLGLLGMVELAGAASLTLFKGLFILVLAPEFFNPLRTLASYWHDRAGALAAAHTLRELLEAPVARVEPAVPAAAVPKRPCAIRIEGLHKQFPGRPAVLRGVDLEVAPGEKLVISGPSGCGKSTLLSLIAGFGEPDAGSILIDGTAVGQYTRAQLAELRGYLGQRPLLLPESVEHNIRYGDEDADEAALQQALALSGVAAFLDRLPQGLATPLGESGHGISGGQARRVALARVVLKPRPLLLLDEPTASLDGQAEQDFWRALDHVLSERPMTVVCTSHSAQAEAWADRVVRLHLGQIEESSHV